jgi:hypothetical protein
MEVIAAAQDLKCGLCEIEFFKDTLFCTSEDSSPSSHDHTVALPEN